MDRSTFLNCLLDDGIYEIETNYLSLDQKNKREGAIAGFNACRGKSDGEILLLLEETKDNVAKAYDSGIEIEVKDYWYYRYYQLQVEWVLNVLSAAMYHHGLEPLVSPTVRGSLKAANILNGETLS